MFLGNLACLFSWLVAAIIAGSADISMSVCLSLVEASSVIYKDPSHSDNISILFVLLELIVVSSCSYCYTCFIFSTDNAVLFRS